MPSARPPVFGGNMRRAPFAGVIALALALGLAVRLPLLFAPLQLDEFNTLFEIASRSGAGEYRLPGADASLQLVPDASSVRARAVLPYGIRSAFPVFPLALHALLGRLPLAEWSLRLPSLIAGLATVGVLALIALRVAGREAAVAVAFLAALEPMLVGTSVTARPYAAAGLTIALSFLLHPAVLAPARLLGLGASAVGYALAVALTGYLNPVLLLAGAAHLALALLPLVRTGPAGRRIQFRRAGAWAAGSVIALLLLLPLAPYIAQVSELQHRWSAYLSSPCHWLGSQLTPTFFLVHNLAFLVLILECAMTWMVARRRGDHPGANRLPAVDAESAAGGIDGGPAALTVVGAICLCAPQAAAVLFRLTSGEGVFLDRYLFYTSFGGVLLIAGLAAGRTTAAARKETTALCTAALLCLLLVRQSHGGNLMKTDRFPLPARRALSKLDGPQLWRENDLLLFHSVLLEADLLPDAVPGENRGVVREALLASLSTLYVGALPRDAIALSESLSCVDAASSCIGRGYQLQDRFYGESLAARLRAHPRLWFLGLSRDSPEFFACLLPWLASSLDSTLIVSFRSLERPESVLRTIRVLPGQNVWTRLKVPEDSLSGSLVLIERTR